MNFVDMHFVQEEKKLSCRLFDKHSNKLIVFFSGLRPRTNSLTTFYNRITWVDDFEHSCLFVSDPTMLFDSSLRGGYYQGTDKWFGVEYCAEIISKIATMLNITENNVLLYGSSQGGFAALAIHAFLTRTKVLAESPQNDLSVLTSAKLDRINMLKSVYGTDSFDDLNNELRFRTCIVKLYSEYTPSFRNINLIVKETDLIHINDHINPLIKAYPEISFDIITGEMGLGGHSAINKAVIKDKVKLIFES